ncbi:MAG: hypothetical protein AAB320_04805 [Elusimicrobiota bacterium]
MKHLRFWVALAAVVGLMGWAIRSSGETRRSEERRRDRDDFQRLAESAERQGHPWAGVYIASRGGSETEATLLIQPSGRFLGAGYKGMWADKDVSAEGRAEYQAPRLRLTFERAQGSGERARFSGSYRLVAWGEVRCLIRPNEARRFLRCAVIDCEDFHPLCRRGAIYGQPDLPAELKEARRDPAFSYPWATSRRVPSFLYPMAGRRD